MSQMLGKVFLVDPLSALFLVINRVVRILSIFLCHLDEFSLLLGGCLGDPVAILLHVVCPFGLVTLASPYCLPVFADIVPIVAIAACVTPFVSSLFVTF